MRYILLLLFAIFLIFSIDFATQNTISVFLNYKLEWLDFNFNLKKPVFVPIFFSFAIGIIFSVLYFFISHAFLLRKLRIYRKEIKKLETTIKEEKAKTHSVIQNKEIQQDDQNLQEDKDFLNSQESMELDNVDSYNYKK